MMTMRKLIFLVLPALLPGLCTIHAQSIGIGATNPHNSAVLEIRSTSKGLLLPRITLLHDSDQVTVNSPLKSLLLFNTNNGLPDGEGYYFWNGSKWSKLATRSNIDNLTWGIQGNAGTNAVTDFIGTRDDRPLVFKTNNILSGRIDPGPNNVFLGQYAGLQNNSNGTNNTFIGHVAGQFNTNGSNNLFAGNLAGNQNTTGNENVFAGQDAGKNNSSGNQNVFVGEDAGIENTTGSQNVFAGNGAGRNNTTGSSNVYIGHDAGTNAAGIENILIGRGAGAGCEADGNIAIGFESLAMFSVSSSPLRKTIAIGYRAGHQVTTGFNGIYIGNAAGYQFSGLNGGGIAIGDSAMFSNGEDKSIAIGKNALKNLVSGFHNVGMGFQSLVNVANGQRNTAIGSFSGDEVVNGDDNIAIGYSAGTTGPGLNHTTALGNHARVSSGNTMVFGDEAVERWAFGLTTTNAQHALEVGSIPGNGNGAYLTQGGVWTNTSDSTKKEDFTVLNLPGLLQQVASLGISKWKYKGTAEYHIGPTAQEFHRVFGLGTDNRGISTIDPAGIALAAIQELIKVNTELRHELESIRKEISTWKQQSKNSK